MIFVDTWAWIGMADDSDQYHAAVLSNTASISRKIGAT
jgi:predicted nucleic acid-binding protein